MRIEEIHIHNFGIWREQSFYLRAPVTLYLGQNESGKSTFMSLIRFIMFGTPTRGDIAELPMPEVGADIGGKLVITDDQGHRYSLERYRKAVASGRKGHERVLVTHPDGTVIEGDDGFIGRLMGGITASLYRNLFAFSLSELQRLASLQNDEIGGYLFSSGYGIAPHAIMQAEKQLEQEMNRLFRPRGKKMPLNQELQRLSETDQALIEWRTRSSTYNDRLQELAESDEQINALEEQCAKLEKQRLWIETGISVWPHWLRRAEIQKELDELPELSSFPHDALARYELMLSQQEEIRQRQDDLSQEISTLTLQMDQIVIDEQRIAMGPKVVDKLEQYSAYDERRIQLTDRLAERKQLAQELERCLQQIDPAWTETELIRFPLSVADKEWVRTFGLQIERARERQKDTLAEEQRLEEQLTASQQRIDQLRSETEQFKRASYEAHGWDSSLSIDEVNDQLLGMQSTLEELRHTIHERQLAAKTLEDVKRWEAEFRQWQSTKRRSMPSLFFVGLLLLIAGSMSIYFWFEGLTIGAWLSLGLLIGLALYGITMILRSDTKQVKSNPVNRTVGNRSQSLRRSDTPARSSGVSEHLQGLAAELAEYDQKIEILYQKLADLSPVAKGIGEAAASLGQYEELKTIGPPPTHRSDAEWHMSLDSLVRDVQAAIDTLNRCRYEEATFKRELRNEQRQLTRLLEQHETAREAANRAEQDVASLLAEWQSWLGQYQLPSHVSPDVVLHMFSLVEQGRRSLSQLRALNEQISSIEHDVRSYEQEVCALLQLEDASRLESALREAKHEAEQQMRQKEKLELIKLKLADAEGESITIAQTLTRLTQDIERLMAEAKAVSDEDFRKRTVMHARYQELIAEQRQLDVLLEHAAGKHGEAELSAMFQAMDELHLQQEHRRLAKELEQSQHLLNELKEKRGRLLSELERLGTDEHHATLLQRREEQWSTVQSLTEAWAKRALALELIRSTRKKAEQERQPQVMIRASAYLQSMTKGRYRTVAANVTEQTISVLRADGTKMAPSQLSRGTAEQLYLAIRWALAEEHAKRVAVPIMMDDIFVNFDGERLTQSLRMLNELSRVHQVLLFTCHDHVRQVAEQAIPHLQTIEFGV